MKEFRPSTWIILGILVLVIFAPLFFIDIDGLETTLPPPADNGLRPSVPEGSPVRPVLAPSNTPDDPPGNQPQDLPPGNGPDEQQSN